MDGLIIKYLHLVPTLPGQLCNGGKGERKPFEKCLNIKYINCTLETVVSLLKAFRVDRYTLQHDSDSWDPQTRYLHTVDGSTNTAMSDEIHELVSGNP